MDEQVVSDGTVTVQSVERIRTPVDSELKAMGQILKILDTLEQGAALRVTSWVSNRVWERGMAPFPGTPIPAPPPHFPPRHLPEERTRSPQKRSARRQRLSYFAPPNVRLDLSNR